MPYEILEDTPYRGEIHILTTPADLDALPLAGRKLLTVYQREQFCDFPGALLALAESAELPYVAAWLRALAQMDARAAASGLRAGGQDQLRGLRLRRRLVGFPAVVADVAQDPMKLHRSGRTDH